MKRAYLDNASATPLSARSARAMARASRLFGNPGSIHREGVMAKQALENFRRDVAEMIDATPDEVVFAGSATESLNIAIRGVVGAWKSMYPGRIPELIISCVEHAAVLETVRSLAGEGVVVRYLALRSDGVVDLSSLRDMLTENTVLVALMYANNETGNIQPIQGAAKIIRDHRFAQGAKTREELAYPVLLSDACQATQYLDISTKRLGVDLLVLNAAKIGGPKGASVLFRRRPVPLTPLIVGGGQERGARAGTEDLAAIAGLVEALHVARGRTEKEGRRVARLRDELELGIRKIYPDAHFNGEGGERLPNFSSVSFLGVDHEYVAIMLDREGVSVSTKSACTETEAEVSHVLSALRDAGNGVGYPPSGIRLSLGAATTREDVRRALSALRRIRGRMVPLV